MKSIIIILDRISELLLGLSMIAITLILCLEVVTRYFLKIPAPWTDEVARFILIWLSFLGVGIGMRRKAHVRVSMLLSYCNARTARYFTLLADLLVVSFGIVLIVFGIGYLKLSMLMKFPVLEISFGWRALVVPITGIFIILYGICEMLENKQSPEIHGH